MAKNALGESFGRLQNYKKMIWEALKWLKAGVWRPEMVWKAPF